MGNYTNQLIGVVEEPPNYQHGSSMGCGIRRSISVATNGYFLSVTEKRTRRGMGHGYKPRGKSLADKRKGFTRDLIRPCKAVWF